MSAETSPTRRGIDSLSIRDHVLGLGDQIAQSVAIGEAIEGLPNGESIANIVFLGMGASGTVGDIVSTVGDLFLSVPVVVAKGYDTPSFVGNDSLVVVVSYSGETDEAIVSAEEAESFGAQLMVVTAGGRLGELADEWGAARVHVPTDVPTPRASIANLSIPVLVALERMGLFAGAHAWIDAAAEQLKRRGEQLASDKSPAEVLARRLGRNIPIAYGAGAVGKVAATRWKTQINENAKSPAFYNVVPEMCHNELIGWGQNGDLTRQIFQMVFLRHDEEHPQEARRFEVLLGLLEEVVGDIHTVSAEGDGALAQMLDLMMFGDMVSLELAAQEGLDPGPTPVLDDLKSLLSHG